MIREIMYGQPCLACRPNSLEHDFQLSLNHPNAQVYIMFMGGAGMLKEQGHCTCPSGWARRPRTYGFLHSY